jgi:hypothetical protein
MAVDTSWTAPTGATLDLAAGAIVGETNWDALVSNVNRLGGTDGNAKTGKYQIGTATSYSNTFNSAGLTINQGTADDEAFSLKSSDVAHGITGIAETDTYGVAQKFAATTGGTSLRAFSAGTGALQLLAVHTTDDTAKTAAASGVFMVDGRVKSGTGNAALGANANIIVFQNNSQTRFILDGDGDSHQDIGTSWTNFSDHDDVGLLTLMSAYVTREDDPLKERFRSFLNERREQLEELKLVTFNEDGHHFVNMSRLVMLLVGAAIQTGRRLSLVERALTG